MKTIHVVAALIRRGDKVFATQRGYGDLKGGWEFPGGKIAEGETAPQALVREIREELDTEISVGKHFMTVEYDYPTFHLCMECYWASIIEGDLALLEHMNSCWLGREEMRRLEWLPADLQIIEKMEQEGIALKNLVFDVGHVLLSYRWKDMLIEHGLSPEESERIGESIFSHPDWTDKFDRGIASPEDMIDTYRQIYPEDEEDIRWFIENAQLMRGKDRKEIWQEIARLKEAGYGIYILSNYSEYMFRLHTQESCFMEMLDGGVVSYEAQSIKPEAAIYQYLFDKYGLRPEECLFFDDRYENVEASHSHGMDAVWVTSEEMLLETLKHL